MNTIPPNLFDTTEKITDYKIPNGLSSIDGMFIHDSYYINLVTDTGQNHMFDIYVNSNIEFISIYNKFYRVTSDCKPWALRDILALCHMNIFVQKFTGTTWQITTDTINAHFRKSFLSFLYGQDFLEVYNEDS